jgi:LmbE family N-acetylglucosaminyl deacetylase
MSLRARGRRTADRLLRWLASTGLPRPRVEPPPTGRIVILAPHPDDETLGCGGSAALCAQAGCDVRVLVLTDGRRGDPSFESDPAALARARAGEVHQACATLGLKPPELLGIPDGTLALDPRASNRIREALERLAPEVVFLPFLADNHADHVAANRLFLGATSPASAIEVYAYEIWSPLHPNCVIDIGAAVERKRAALACYGSQLRRQALLEQALALNRYRGIHLPQPDGHAEAFYRCPASEYRKVWRAVHG